MPPLYPNHDRHSHARNHEPACLPCEKATIIRTIVTPANRRQRQPPLTRPPPPRSQAGGFAVGDRAACSEREIDTHRRPSPASRIKNKGAAVPELAPGPGARSLLAGPRGEESLSCRRPVTTIQHHPPLGVFTPLLAGQNCGVFAPGRRICRDTGGWGRQGGRVEGLLLQATE